MSVAACAPPAHTDPSAGRPRVTFAEGAPADLQRLAAGTWERFTQAFSARRSCIEPVTVDGAWRLEDRARYDPDRRLVTVRIPASAPNLEGSLVHEFAHHLEFTCPAQRGLRPAFLRSLGRSRDTPWLGGASWERTPSEQFAEATTEFVLGGRVAYLGLEVSPAAVRTVRRWATGPIRHRP